ncbi:hypothetical protein AALO_G00274980 [Alosa alosa]|uniref:Uncharacterized protein n=1 Tax=Alosa alosa TaxID=278164 RepID=A0AAV6FMI8_9TELE|nr:hypothetical protein AALO_G00274980 [Alosa alosa]
MQYHWPCQMCIAPKKTNSVEPRAECGSTRRTTNIDADQDHVNLSPMVRHLVENMTEEHWRIVCEALHVPGTSDAKKARELSIPLLDQLTGTEFRKRATEQVSEVLLNTLDSDSCPESPAEVFAKDDHESNTKAESQTDLCELPAFYPPGTHSQSVADDLVGDVIDSMNEDSGQRSLSSV